MPKTKKGAPGHAYNYVGKGGSESPKGASYGSIHNKGKAFKVKATGFPKLKSK